MSYNNIGLTTPRGSGTSGYIVRNLSGIRPRDPIPQGRDTLDLLRHRKPDAAILEHERKRRIENKCVELRIELEDDGKMTEDQIDEKVDELRVTLQKTGLSRERGSLKEYETHELAALKAAESAKFSAALNIRKDHVEGAAFDRELQEKRKAEVMEERAQRDADRIVRLSKQKEEREARDLAREESRKEIKARQEEAERRRDALEAERVKSNEERRSASNNRDRDRNRREPQRRGRSLRSRSPDDRKRSLSRSPSPSRRSHRDSRSRSPPPRRQFSRSRSRSVSRERRPPVFGPGSRRGPPARRAARAQSRSRSPPPYSRNNRRSMSPRPRSPPRRKFSPTPEPRERGDRHDNTLAAPPPGFRPIRQGEEVSKRNKSASPRRARSRSTDNGRSDRSGSMSMSEGSN